MEASEKPWDGRERRGGDRRQNVLSHSEMEALKEQLLESIYADVGKSIISKFLWVGGAILLAVLAWLTGSKHIVIGGP